MKRIDFINKLIALGGLSFLPKGIVKNYQKFYLLQCFVRGFRFYEGPSLLDQMKEQDLLELVREPDNEHDSFAIALHWNKIKIGYIPSEQNELLSKLLDIGIPELVAEITFLNKEAKAWENVSIAIYVLKETNEIPANAAWLTMLETPHYTSVKRGDNNLSKVFYEEEDDVEEFNYNSYYDFLVDNSKDNSIYSHIHNNLDANAHYEEQFDFLIVNKNKLASKPQLLDRLKQIESDVYNAEEMFDDDGYIVLNVTRADNFIKEISGLGDVADKLGRKFIELKF